jgi:hypothetical protein
VPGVGCAAGHCHRGSAHLSPSKPQGPARIRAGIHPLGIRAPLTEAPRPRSAAVLERDLQQCQPAVRSPLVSRACPASQQDTAQCVAATRFTPTGQAQCTNYWGHGSFVAQPLPLHNPHGEERLASYEHFCGSPACLRRVTRAEAL